MDPLKHEAPGCLVYINGYPGVGKLTIATHLCTLLGSSRALLIDNHQLIDPVTIPRSAGEAYYAERRRIRQAALENYVLAPQMQNKIIVFTDSQVVGPVGPGVAAEFEAAARQSGRAFLPVYITCLEEENWRRLGSEERGKGGKGKLMDVDILKGIIRDMELFRFADVPGLSIDATTRKPEDAAGEILLAIKDIVGLGE
ncbi:uncharacterized protein BCR38DRAFT_340299 [Pseudomassariella vexata]|uniref:P-loop containing nucleoside triphosphate hydrolase protein n=1 Tax=Pseudomassariella vexata TaxID=1141098 RepID=A0A1Y2E3K1_9PEZI|nr:uncharacterized protein BCR38DRAFT_340299 [Pseudomassariella vexata]ORY66133.1 hypothetical protein BCR38DRAFT_340299 [Pseudomassariella vexata]